MKKIIAILLMLTLALSLVACNSEPSAYEDHFDHQTPEEMSTHTKTLLERADFGEYMESILNVTAYPDILMYNPEGTEVIGMYIYDPETGLATGWTDLTTGQQTTYEAGKEVNLGKPDPAKMVDVDTIKLGIAVYEKDGLATGAEFYFYLTDAKDAEQLMRFVENNYGMTLTQKSEKEYAVIKDAAAVMADFAKEEKAGNAFFSKNAAEYISVLKVNYGVTPVA